ncbi:hypothetical protein [Inhella gelatinilytica]|uniref:Solute-binding protein family 3/N-terminal domain-containing protein n=1 Tax=Inhella gelatinilytica TaxID=2795030 RepID=A0A931NCX1_9BURK|nr:hypothetical protein [Inhella gelatinilytica]MBH9551660.1 hypothetical protein [Inhella gelatinilytica]
MSGLAFAIPRRALLAGAAAGGWRPAGAAEALRMAGPRDENDHRHEYPMALARLALEAGGLPLPMEPVAGLTQPRIADELRGGALDVAVLATAGQDASGLAVVRQPVRRGLLGVRLLLARRELAETLSRVRSLRELQRYRLGYGADWADLERMRQVGFRVEPSTSYTGLFRMLALGRFDFLSRGVNEVWAEVDHPLLVPHGIVVVPRIALFYPLDDYFYVNPQRTDVAAALETGLRRIRRDGRFTRLFMSFFGRGLERADLKRRQVYAVHGYGVEPQTPLEDFDVLQLEPSQGRFQTP